MISSNGWNLTPINLSTTYEFTITLATTTETPSHEPILQGIHHCGDSIGLLANRCMCRRVSNAAGSEEQKTSFAAKSSNPA